MMRGDPTVALRALCRRQPTFTHDELVQFLKPRTGDQAQLDAVLAAIMESSELAALAPDGAAPARFTSRDMLEAEKSLMKRAAVMTARRGRGAAPGPRLSELARSELPQVTEAPQLSEEQRRAFEYIAGDGDIKALAAAAYDGKSLLLAALREHWESRGLTVIGAALSPAAAHTLQGSSGIGSQTLESLELQWREGRVPMTPNHVLVVDGAEMIGVKQLERLLAAVDRARGKVVLVGDSQQLEAMGSMSPLRSILAGVSRAGHP